MARQLTALESMRKADAILVGAHALSRDEDQLPDIRLAKVRLLIVDASMLLTAAIEQLQPEPVEKAG